MYIFEAEDSNDMAIRVYHALAEEGVQSGSRNGRVLRLDEPVSMTYYNPESRCNFTTGRDANPVFHHMEALWMLAGRQDVEYLSMFNSNIKNYSDDGEVFNAPYGYRIRRAYGHDQLKEVVKILQADPESRQAVIQLWDHKDLMKDTKDKACNMIMVFAITVDKSVRLTVYNRSNDAVYGGVTGANPVHFSYFLQYVAQELSLSIGEMCFVSNNLHIYLDLYDLWEKMDWSSSTQIQGEHLELGSLEEIEEFCELAMNQEVIEHTFHSPTLNWLSKPMYNFWIARKQGLSTQEDHLEDIRPADWAHAVNQWKEKRDGH